jgi:hypothetical protein
MLENSFNPVAKIGDAVISSGYTEDEKNNSGSDVDSDAMVIDDEEDQDK